MALNYLNLDDQTRVFMGEEIEMDIADGKIYISKRLTLAGREDWPNLIRIAAQTNDDGWLANQLRNKGNLKDTGQRKNKDGSYKEVKVPHNAPDTLAEGEFNRYYARGLCRRAIDEGIDHVVVYRAKDVAEPRPESDAKIGAKYPPGAILDDLRNATGVASDLGIPSGPNSGLSLKLP